MGWALIVQEAQSQLGANPRSADARWGPQRSVSVCAWLLPKHRKSYGLSVEAVRTSGQADLWIESEQNLCSRSMGKEAELSQQACAGL